MEKVQPSIQKATTIKGIKKLTIETQLSGTAGVLNPQPQTTKSASKNALNCISNYRLMQYQKQAHNLRNTAAGSGSKRHLLKSKRGNLTLAANNSNSSKSKIVEKSMKEGSVEKSACVEKNEIAKVGEVKASHAKRSEPGVKHSGSSKHTLSETKPTALIHIPPGFPASKREVQVNTKSPRIDAIAKAKAILHTTYHLESDHCAAKYASEHNQHITPKNSTAERKLGLNSSQQFPKKKEKSSILNQISKIQDLLKKTTNPVQSQRNSLNPLPRKPKVGISNKNSFTTTLASPAFKAGSPKSSAKIVIATPKQREDIEGLQYPISVAKALKAFADRLEDDEKAEMLDYKEIYFMGTAITKKDHKTARMNQKSYGYDDDKGDYNAFVGEHIGYRYEILDLLGKGSFGQVIKCYDHKAKMNVALKIIRSKKRFYHQATVEVKLLKFIVDNDPKDQFNLVRMYDYFIFRKHICITFELLNSNLYELTKDNDFRGFPQELIRKFAIQILQSLLFLKEHSIIHCDLKPENILLRQPNKSGIKLIDLGSGCFSDEKIYTYIQSRFYRAPEIMLAIPYTCGSGEF